MLDIHTHVIPFVDDGSKSLQDSIEMIKHEASLGVTDIMCTPHHIYKRFVKSVDEIKENFDLLVEEVKKQSIPVNLYLGQEIYYTTRENTIELLENNELLTLNNTRYVLVEFSFDHEPEEINEVIYNFKCHNYKLIIAHVERYTWMTYDKIIRLRNEGALIQINADAVVGKTTFKQHLFVKKLLKNNLVDIIASDTHSFRPSHINLAYKKAHKLSPIEMDILSN